MKSFRVFTCLIALAAAGTARVCDAQLHLATAQAIASAVGESMEPRVEETHSGNPQAYATAELQIGTTIAAAQAYATENTLGGYADVGATGEINDTMGGFATATWKDTLYFDRNGVRLTSGSVQVSADVDGRISLSGDGASGSVTLHLLAGSSAGEITFSENGSFSDTLDVVATGNFSAGLPVQIQLRIGAGNRTFNSSLSHVDFLQTATIKSIAYLTPAGLPDRSVTVTSSSGVIYGVPEPTGAAIAIACLCGATRKFRRRS